MSAPDMIAATHESPPTLGEATRVWWKIGILSFGGPAAQIALMNREVVEERNWLSEREFLGALSFCMLLPGPEAMQLATYAGWKLHGVKGGLIAGGLFVLPGAIILAALAALYSLFGSVPLIDALFLGIKASVIAIVIEALLRISNRALTGSGAILLAIAAFAAIFLFEVPYPLIVLVAAMIGYFAFSRPRDGDEIVKISQRPAQTLATAATWLAIWLVPLGILHVITDGGFLAQVGTFFSKLAIVTFGGAYAVLAYMAQDVVQSLGWLEAREMVDGLGLAETTPGPLILVTEFVGFLAGFKEGGISLALAAAMVTLWVTFIPCFAWIFTGAPYVDWISAQPRLRGALSGITAAVVGVIAHLSLWFAIHVFFGSVGKAQFGPLSLIWPEWQTLDWRPLLLAILAAWLLFFRHWNIPALLTVCAAGGLILSGINP